jgi:hypothetical protein
MTTQHVIKIDGIVRPVTYADKQKVIFEDKCWLGVFWIRKKVVVVRSAVSGRFTKVRMLEH